MSITEENRLELEKKRREQILAVALGLFYKNGYKNTSMADIAKTAGISKGLIYHYFKSKAELLFSYQDKLDECLEEINTISSARKAIYEFGCRFLLNELDETGYIPPLQVYVIVFVKGEMDDPEYQDRNPLYQDFRQKFFEPLFRKGIENGEFKPGDPENYADIYWHYLLGSVLEVTETRGSTEKTPDLNKILDLFI
ncbi:MAG: TetR/AcrR family transcriptional regulator [Eubacteriaceae bacterium]|nr:TetR/AcrR family transcriptional regulator [Eubacteriaceae bacterium]